MSGGEEYMSLLLHYNVPSNRFNLKENGERQEGGFALSACRLGGIRIRELVRINAG